MRKRDIAVAIVLSVVTCGIYSLYWFVCLTDDANEACGDSGATTGGMALLFNLITCGIYGIYWSYKMGEKLDCAKERHGLSTKGYGILYLILCIFGFSIIGYALMQDELNKLANLCVND